MKQVLGNTLLLTGPVITLKIGVKYKPENVVSTPQIPSMADSDTKIVGSNIVSVTNTEIIRQGPIINNSVATFQTPLDQPPVKPNLVLKIMSSDFGKGKHLDWDSVSHKDCPVIECDKCACKATFHPNFIAEKMTPCVRKGCDKIEDAVNKFLDYRGYTLIKIDKEQYEVIVHYKCCKNHTCHISYRKLRLGSGCNQCKHDKKMKQKAAKRPDNTKVKPVPCDCKAKKLGKSHAKAYVCKHNNFGVLYPDLAADWDYKHAGNKGLTPCDIPPNSAKKYWFICREEKCKNSYDQPIKKKTQRNDGCSYCKGTKVNHTNCLSTTHPELAKEYDPDNEIPVDQITAKSGEIVGWICDKHDEPFKFQASPSRRTDFLRPSGCRKCNFAGHAQEEGGHEFFVEQARKVHGLENYSYPERYINNVTPINIHCHSIVPNSNPPREHGLFLQTPESHKNGSGCTKCAEERYGSRLEKEVKHYLNEMEITYGVDQTLPGLKYISSLFVDILIDIPEKFPRKIVIEVDGRQHFQSISTWGGDQDFELRKTRDKVKDLYCTQNNITLIRVPYSVIATKEYVEDILRLCKSEKQVYRSYPHYIDAIKESSDLTDINVIPINYK